MAGHSPCTSMAPTLRIMAYPAAGLVPCRSNRSDGIGVIDARELVSGEQGAIAALHAEGYVVPPFAMPPLETLLDPPSPGLASNCRCMGRLASRPPYPGMGG